MAPSWFSKSGISIGLVTFSLAVSSPVSLTLWQLSPQGLQPATWQAASPVKSSPVNPPAQAEWNNGSVKLTSTSGSWQSPDTWTVQNMEWSDLNHDGRVELTLLVKRPFKPWPVDQFLPYGGRIKNHHDIAGNSSHIIMIGWKKDHWGEVWAGSALARPVRMFTTADVNQDGIQELVVLEGDYDDTNVSQASSLAIWKWDGFGFELVSRLEQPCRQFILTYSRQNEPLILLQ